METALRGRNARKNNWLAIENLYGKSVKDVILDLREQHGWAHVAAELEVSEWTLLNWRRALGMDINHADYKRERYL